MKIIAIVSIIIASAFAHKLKGGKKNYPRIPILPPVLPTPVPILKPLPPSPPPTYADSYECTEPTINCPNGYELRGSLCVRDVIVNPNFNCRQGFLQGEMCVISVDSRPQCEPGFELRGRICSRSVTEPGIHVCPEGYQDRGHECVREVPAPVVDVCTRGTRIGNSCVIRHTSAPKVNNYCPPEFEMENGECCRIETYDCTPAGTTPLDCNSARIGSECIEGDTGLRYLKGKKGLLLASGPVLYQGPPALPVIPSAPIERTEEIAVVQKTCQKKVTTPILSDTYCEVGQLVGHSCVQETQIALEQRCSVGGSPSHCFSTITAPHQHRCARGQTSIGNSCVSTETVSPFPTCGPGFELRDNECIRLVPANPICRQGTLGSNNLCVDTEFAPTITTWCVTCTGSTCRPIGCNR